MKKNRHFTTAVCFIVGIVILTTAAFANYGNANGYTAYKEAVKKMLYMDNFSANIEVSLYDDDVRLANAENEYKLSGGDVASYSRSRSVENISGTDQTYESESWVVKGADGNHLSYNRYSNGEWNINKYYGDVNRLSAISSEENASKIIRFVEAALDVFVGDLKNNFVYTGSDKGNSNYQLVLSGAQMPEIVNAGISLLFGGMQSENNYGRVINEYAGNSSIAYRASSSYSSAYDDSVYSDAWDLINENGGRGVAVITKDGEIKYFSEMKDYYLSDYYTYDPTDYDSIFETMATEPVIETAECYLTLDDSGNLISNTLVGAVRITNYFGDTNVFRLEIKIDLSDIGSTVIDMPVIPADATIYDYSIGNSENGWAYTVTKRGIVVSNSRNEDSLVMNREWFYSMDSEERLQYVCDMLGIDMEKPNDILAAIQLTIAAGEYENYLYQETGLDAELFVGQIVGDLIAVYGGEASDYGIIDNTATGIPGEEASE